MGRQDGEGSKIVKRKDRNLWVQSIWIDETSRQACGKNKKEVRDKVKTLKAEADTHSNQLRSYRSPMRRGATTDKLQCDKVRVGFSR